MYRINYGIWARPGFLLCSPFFRRDISIFIIYFISQLEHWRQLLLKYFNRQDNRRWTGLIFFPGSKNVRAWVHACTRVFTCVWFYKFMPWFDRYEIKCNFIFPGSSLTRFPISTVLPATRTTDYVAYHGSNVKYEHREIASTVELACVFFFYPYSRLPAFPGRFFHAPYNIPPFKRAKGYFPPSP